MTYLTISISNQSQKIQNKYRIYLIISKLTTTSTIFFVPGSVMVNLPLASGELSPQYQSRTRSPAGLFTDAEVVVDEVVAGL